MSGNSAIFESISGTVLSTVAYFVGTTATANGAETISFNKSTSS